MRLTIILVTEGMAPAEAANFLATLPDLLRLGDQLVLTDSGSDPDLSLALADLAEPEAMPEGVDLTVLRFGVMPAASRWTQANAALAEADRDALLCLFAGQKPAARALAAARAELAAGPADLVLAGGPRPVADRKAWLGRIPDLDPAPMLIRREWLLRQGLRLAEMGPAPDRVRHWQLCAAAGRVGWIADPLCQVAPPVLPADGAGLLDLHAALIAMDPGLHAPALRWLIGAQADAGPDLPPDERWILAAGLADRFAACPDSQWRAAIAGVGPGRAAATAAALRRGAVPEVVTCWAQAAAEDRLAALETGLARLQDSAARMQRGLDSLCRIAEYDALAAGWAETDGSESP